MNNSLDPKTIDWAKGDGLVPAIIQDAANGAVLMLGYMNEAALRATLASGRVTFFSRSKNRLWEKGESSGNTLALRDIRCDCDNDALLVLADPAGPTCHTGSQSCFKDTSGCAIAILGELEATIQERKNNPREGSYTCDLFRQGLARIAQKVGEEGVEVALAGALQSETVASESADLLYHLLVLWAASGLAVADVLAVLKQRHAHQAQAK